MQNHELHALLNTGSFDYTEEQVDLIRTVLENYEQDDPDYDDPDYDSAVIAVAVGDDTLENLGHQLAQARRQEAKALAEVMAAVRVEYERGVSEYQLAKLAGVSRSTIRSWLGK